MIQANTNNRWARLSQSEKAELLGIYASKGYNDLASIIAHYNSCGGNLHGNGGPVSNSGWNIGASIINKIKKKYLSDYADKGYVYSYPSNPFELFGYAISPYARTSEYGNYMLDVMPKNITDARRALFAKNFGVNSDGKDYENAIVESRYRPTVSSNPNAKYYTLPIDDPEARFEDLQSVIGTAKYDFGEDKNGKYISVYDKWDLAPITDKGSDFLNATPPEIYDRFYQSEIPKIYSAYSMPGTDFTVHSSGMDFASGGKIHIKPENRGKFTALKERTGHSASWFKEHGTPAQKKMAVFALNARKWKHEDGGPVNIYDGETEPTQKMDIPVKFDKPLKLAEIPTRNRVNVIDNYSNNYNYIVEGDKIYYAKKGNDYWVDISDNETARLNLLNFISQRYDFKGYEDSERDILGLITNNNFNYQEYHDRKPEQEKKKGFTDYRLYSPVPPVSRISDAPIYKDQKKETPPVIAEEPKQTKEDVDLREVQRILLAEDPANYGVQRDVLRSDMVYDPTNSTPRYEPTLLERLKDSDNPNISGLAETYESDGFRGLWNLARNWGIRQIDQLTSKSEPTVSDFVTETTLDDSAYGIIPGSFTGDTLSYSRGVLPREYFIPESINTDDYKFGARNRGDYTPLNTEGGVITAFNSFLPYSEKNINKDYTYVGIDKNGNLKVGPGSDFGEGDLMTRTFANEVYSFAKDGRGNYKFQSDAKHGNSKYNVALVNVKDEKTGQMKESSAFNILVNPGDKGGTTYGSITGGRVLVKVGNETRLLSGSIQQIEQQFEEMKKRQHTDHGTFYTLDNGSYNKALRTRSGKITKADLENYDRKNVSGGNFLYLNGQRESKFPVDTVLTPNVRTEQDKSYLNGHPLINENRGVVLHYTAFQGNDMDGVTNRFMDPESQVSSHVVIGKNGERRVFADPEKVTFHAGDSSFGGRESVNDFMNGIEFMAAGPNEKLTDAQVQSAVEYLLPIIRKYNIPLENITTHEVVRRNYKEAHPREKVPPKQDLSPAQYNQVIEALKKAVYYEKPKEEIPLFNWDIDPEILAKPMKNGGPLQKYADFSGLF